MSKYVKKHTRSKNWTQEEYNTVLQMDLEGYTQQEIADHIGRTKSSVKSKMYTLQYRMDKAAITKDHRFEPGAVYLISENETPRYVAFLPNKFIYEGKIQGRKEKHIFRSINGGYLLTFTDAQFGGYRFKKEGEDYAERIRENAGRNKGGSTQEGDVTGEGRQGSQKNCCCYVEQKTS